MASNCVETIGHIYEYTGTLTKEHLIKCPLKNQKLYCGCLPN